MIGMQARTLERKLPTTMRMLLAVAGVLLVVALGLAGPAKAQSDSSDYPLTSPPSVLPSSTVPLASSTVPDGGGGGTLPLTGADVIGLAIIGAGLVGTGFLVLKARDRRAQTV